MLLAATAACTSRTPDVADPSTPPLSSVSATPSYTSPSPQVTSAAPLLTGKPRLAEVGSFNQPVHVASPPGDSRLFVVEKEGRIRVVKAGRVNPQPFLDIVRDVSSSGEQGLLSVAFAPDFATSGLLYIHYNNRDGDTRVDELRVRDDPDRADMSTRRRVLSVDQPYANHKGGLLLFDQSGMLMLGLGDGGSAGDPENRAQDLGTLLGKLLRINPRPSGGRPYSVPTDNPFVGRAGARPEIWAYGLRNPWRYSIAPDGRLWVGDVGQYRFEEINVVARDKQAGANFGWRAYEGNQRFREQRIDESRLVRPVHVYNHNDGRCAVTGGVHYNGRVAALRGAYLYGDACSGDVWTYRPDAPMVSLGFGTRRVVSIDALPTGEVYVVSIEGPVYHLTA